jgi:hypothetical protein
MPPGEVTFETKYLRFVEVVWPGKTRKWEVQSIRQNGHVLGHVGWWGPWRQYAFHPVDKTLWDAKCLSDVIGFIARQMEDWRAERRSQQ